MYLHHMWQTSVSRFSRLFSLVFEFGRGRTWSGNLWILEWTVCVNLINSVSAERKTKIDDNAMYFQNNYAAQNGHSVAFVKTIRMFIALIFCVKTETFGMRENNMEQKGALCLAAQVYAGCRGLTNCSQVVDHNPQSTFTLSVQFPLSVLCAQTETRRHWSEMCFRCLLERMSCTSYRGCAVMVKRSNHSCGWQASGNAGTYGLWKEVASCAG